MGGNRSTAVLLYLYAGFLSFALAETFSGSSADWILSPWALLVTYPLYTLHLLLLATVAARFRRTSLGALYLFGVLFGLYETWITKVVWAGYAGNAGFASGGFLGFGFHETLGLVLFYHAVVSFLLPLTVLLLLFPHLREDYALGDWLMAPTRWARVARTGLAVFLGLLGGFAMASVPTVLVTLAPTVVVVVLGYRVLAARFAADPATAPRLPLGDTPLAIVAALLAVLYVAGYLLLRPQAIPSVVVQLATLGVYAAVVLLLWRKDPAVGPSPMPRGSEAPRLLRFLLAAVGLAVPMAFARTLAPGPVGVLATGLYAGMIPAGVGLLLALGLRASA